MNRRINQPDTQADIDLRSCIQSNPPTSFLMVAGAGSGKTTSLIKALNAIIDIHGKRLRSCRQRVSCITYTEIAAGEIWADVGNNPLVSVSTIHSFMWSLVRSFQSDIKSWITTRIEEKLNKLRETVENFGPRVQQKTRDKTQRDIEHYERQRERIKNVSAFTYGTGSDYENGILGHNDIITMVPQFLRESPLLRALLAQQYPFLFVDESQDTSRDVVDAIKAVDHEFGAKFCLGFFGDPMQRIYPTGIGDIALEEGWLKISKPENFRCPTTVLDVANSIRRPVGDLTQVKGRMKKQGDQLVNIPGSAHMFILSTDENRESMLKQVREWMAQQNNEPNWRMNETKDSVKVLVIVHRMAAKRLGFSDLYSALNDNAPEKFKNGFQDATAWPLRPFISFVLPLVSAMRVGQEFEVMQILRANSPFINRDSLKAVDVAERLAEIRKSVSHLGELMAGNSQASNEDVLTHLHESRLLTLDSRIVSYLNLPQLQVENLESDGEDDSDNEELSKEVSAMEAFLACPANQFWGYLTYVNEESPFSTQQGIKGAEFDRVLVVLDDEEGNHNQFSYEKYLGIKPLSARDEANMRQGKQTVVDRTRRLFYVCCTRALQDLAVVLFTPDVQLALNQVNSLDIFPADAIHTSEELERL